MSSPLAALACILGCILTLPAGAQPDARGAGRFADAPEWSRRFDAEERDAWQKPQAVLAALALPGNAVVADIGAGTGYFSVRLAAALPEGRVYAVDIEPEMVKHLRARADDARLGNLRAMQGTRDGPGLPEPVDLVLMVNVQGLLVAPGGYFARLLPALKPGARVAILATRLDSPVGARVEMRVPPDQVKRDMAEQGYGLVAEHDFLAHQYFLVFAPRK